MFNCIFLSISLSVHLFLPLSPLLPPALPFLFFTWKYHGQEEYFNKRVRFYEQHLCYLDSFRCELVLWFLIFFWIQYQTKWHLKIHLSIEGCTELTSASAARLRQRTIVMRISSHYFLLRLIKLPNSLESVS